MANPISKILHFFKPFSFRSLTFDAPDLNKNIFFFHLEKHWMGSERGKKLMSSLAEYHLINMND